MVRPRCARHSERMRRRVLIVDDHGPYRALARRVLERGGFEVVGEAADGASAVAAVRALRPHAVLLDVSLPDVDGAELAAVLAAGEDAPIVVLTSSRPRRDLEPVLRRSDAHAFLPKEQLTAPALAALLA